MGGHPIVDGVPVSANDPRILEKDSFGLLFNARYDEESRALKAEAWLDPSHAQPGSVGEQTINRLRSNASDIELSVGAFVVTDNVPGIYKGKKYACSWQEIAPDHLAFLAEGDIGACSNDMGCGLTAAQREGDKMAKKEEDEATPKRSLRERLLALFSDVLAEEGTGVPETKPVIVPIALKAAEAATEKAEMKTKAERIKALIESKAWTEGDRSFLEAASDCQLGALEILAADKRKDKRPDEEKLAEERQVDPKPGYDDGQPHPPEPPVQPKPTGTEPFVEKRDVDHTEQPKPKTAQSVEQYIANAPAEIADILRENLRSAQAQRDTAITALKATGRCEYTDAELKAFSASQLDKLVKLSAVAVGTDASVNFGARGTPRVASASGVPPPPSLVARIQDGRKH